MLHLVVAMSRSFESFECSGLLGSNVGGENFHQPLPQIPGLVAFSVPETGIVIELWKYMDQPVM